MNIIAQIIADEPQNNKTALPTPTCLCLRYDAACCIRLRHLRDLRENIHIRVLNQSTQKIPQCLPQISQIYADKTQNNKIALTTPICLSLRNNAAFAAFLCVICVICGRITCKRTQTVFTIESPKVSHR